MQIDESYQSQQIFGMDVTNAKPGTPLVLDDTNSFGFPIQHLRDLPAGEYTVQAVFNRYEKFQLANGKTVLLPPDKGEGQHWNRKPGNPMSKPVKVKWTTDGDLRIEANEVIPEVPAPAIRIRSIFATFASAANCSHVSGDGICTCRRS